MSSRCCKSFAEIILRASGHFDGKRVETSVSLLERTTTASPLFKCFRTHYGRHCEPFCGQKALHCRILYMISQKKISGVIPNRRAPVLGRDTITFRLASVPSVPILRNNDSVFCRRQWRRLHKGTGDTLMAWHGGTVSRKTANIKLTKLYRSPGKRSPKRLVVLLEPKN